MRFLIVLAAIASMVAGEATIDKESMCQKDLELFCEGTLPLSLSDKTDCNTEICGFHVVEPDIQKYVMQQVSTSFDYLMLTSYYGNYVKNRPGFHKQFKALSDKAWSNAIDLIKFMTKRGGKMVFEKSSNDKQQAAKTPSVSNGLELDEIKALGYVLDKEKNLAVQANHIHQKVSHAAHPKHYDADTAHYVEEEFLEYQTKNIRKLTGWTSDLRNLIYGQEDPSLSMYLFDEYLQSA